MKTARKKSKIFFILTVIIFLLFLYLVITSEKVEVQPDNNKISEEEGNNFNGPNTFSTKELEDNYRNKTSKILSGYLELNEEEMAISQIKQIKNQLLSLKVPTKFKDLHLDLVLAFIKIEKYLQEGDEQEKLESNQLIIRARANYGWLNGAN